MRSCLPLRGRAGRAPFVHVGKIQAGELAHESAAVEKFE